MTAASPMRVFLSEHCTCGADLAAATGPLFAEGAAMLRALAEDAVQIDGVEVVVTWAEGLEPFGVPGVDVVEVPTSRRGEVEWSTFDRLFRESDCILHVAPEMERILWRRAKLYEEQSGWTGCSTDAIRTCGEKWTAAEVWRNAHVRRPWVAHPCSVISGWTLTAEGAEIITPPRRAPPYVRKPGDGAGGNGTLFTDQRQYDEMTGAESAAYGLTDTMQGNDIVEQWVIGRPCSVAVINHTPLPAGSQDIQIDGSPGRLAYHGGSVPAADVDQDAVNRLVAQVYNAVPGLRGWWGIDFVIPDKPFEGSLDPVLIEVNPRLTTSYLGYRALTPDNLAERILFPERSFPPLRWNPGTSTFTKAGAVTVS
ncbi:hypothetical protein LzC2_39520 [Planctomycetes bacterium LzC2]|uniref:ATP-grasp domain-containing protein n=2 Tax=Alienimonas chondri TaxID=2681879 RepID=A0ABX1VLF0_9PLAN|nr:hypothetical protein [Alienimonas chondri]